MIIRTEYETAPLGLDVEKPHFSWISELNRTEYLQSAYRICVTADDELFWDSGETASSQSSGVRYEGKPLKPCTAYTVTVKTTGEKGEEETGTGTFETGLMDPSGKAFSGAEFIGAPEKYLSASRLGVFVLEADITIEPGSGRGGIVFGADDERLMDPNRNIYGLSGKNYIRYELDISKEPKLNIFRVGYHKEDSESVPFASVRTVPFEENFFETYDHPLITDDNKNETHHLRIEVLGNGALTYLDDVLIDGEVSGMAASMLLGNAEKKDIPAILEKNHVKLTDLVSGRQLNPLGANDVITFPRLNKIGYFAGPGDTVRFSGITISNVREPGRVITATCPGGTVLSGVDENGQEAGCQTVFDPSCHSLPMFRRDFSLDKAIRKARLYVTARGIYDVRINGNAVTDNWFNPGLTEYDKRMNYQTYDVSGLLKNGENGIGVLLAPGWWSDSQTFTVKNVNYFGDREAFLLKLEVTYEDGTSCRIISDPETWTYYGEGPYIYSSFFHGETLDGTRIKEYLDYSCPGCTLDSGIKPVVITPDLIHEVRPAGANFGREWPELNYENVKLEGSYQAPVHEICTLTAKRRFEPRPGVYVYDLEQEIAGVPVIRFKGKAGERAVIRFGEILYPDLPEYGELSGMMLTENYRDAESTDYYILSGDPEGETFKPKYTCHGYRYIEITGIENPPEAEDVKSVQLSSVKEITGSFETSDPLLNRLIENIRWSMLCNFISIPTDCPQRNERMGWAGDTHIFCRTATYEADMQNFYYRYLQAIEDLQKENGEMPMIAPMGGGFGGITYESAMILMAEELYQQYHDTDLLVKFYPAMKKWMLHMEEVGMPGTAYVGPINDWLAFDPTDNGIVWNAFYLRSAALMKKFARLLGKQEDAVHFEEREMLARDYWNGQYLDKEDGTMHGADGKPCDTQCAYALGLAYDCFYEADRERAAGHLVRKIREAGYTIRTGFFGTPILAPMLSAYGYTEDAYKLVLNREFPSWIYPVTQGATTIWERWNSYT
ncbi:MAG: family 78 glycoside hydrolase catalytic domain, partial [Lachnospiraceae bacterium]|nr:family 78 glycoside hydrolase catalytic domain [Lachnospiraceae bacterium]